jgi:hypothetical protein
MDGIGMGWDDGWDGMGWDADGDVAELACSLHAPLGAAYLVATIMPPVVLVLVLVLVLWDGMDVG